MSGKRPAQQPLNQKTLDYEQPKEEPTSSNAPRTVVTVQRDAQGPVLKKDREQDPHNTKQTEEQQPAEKPKIKPLFSDLFQNKQGTGIFTAAKQGVLNQSSEEVKINYKSPNLFNNNGFKAEPPKQPSSLFGNNNNSSSLFGNAGSSLFGSSAGTGGLFGSKEGGSIFNFQQGSIPPVRFGEEAGGDEEGDSAQLEKGQQMKVDKSKSKVRFEYAQEVQVLFSGVVRKYKLNNGDLMEGVQLVLQYDPKTKLAYLVIRLMATKHTIFTGFIIKDKSEVRVLNKKEENLEIAAFTLQKDKPAQLNRLKIQLQTPEKGESLKNQIELAIKGQIILPPSEEEPKEKDNNDVSKEIDNNELEKKKEGESKETSKKEEDQK